MDTELGDDGPAARRSAKQHYAEEMGLFLQDLGLPQMAGRVLGWLFVADPTQQSMEELAEALQASRSSISSSLKLLLVTGWVEKVSIPGERHDHYRVRSGSWSAVYAGRLRSAVRFRELADRGLSILEKDTPEVRRQLEELRHVYVFFERELPPLVERLERELSSRRMAEAPASTSMGPCATDRGAETSTGARDR